MRGNLGGGAPRTFSSTVALILLLRLAASDHDVPASSDDPFALAVRISMAPAATASPSMRPGPPMVVQAMGGIGNRLRVLLSYLAESRAKNRPLKVYWRPDAHCPGSFSSVFQPLPPHEVTLVEEQPPPGVEHTYSAYPGHRITALGPLALELLHPIESIMRRIDTLLASLGWPASRFSAG
jgi:hypothetical protein